MQNVFRYVLGLLLVIGLGGCGNSHDPKKSDIAVAKELFKSLRTQAMGLVKLDNNDSNGFLDTEADRLGRSLEDVMLNIDLTGKYSGAILGEVIQASEEGAASSTVSDVEAGRDVNLRKISPLVWDYNITQGSMLLGAGKVTLPDDNLSTLTLEGGSDLNGSLIGTFPLNSVDSGNAPGIQHGTLKLLLTKESDGALLNIQQMLVTSANALVELSDFTINAKYTDENHIQQMILNGTKMRAEVPGYLYEGTLSLPADKYVANETYTKNSGMIPSRLIFNGSLENSTNHAKITGAMQIDWLNALTMDMSEGSEESAHLKTEIHGLLERPQYQDTNVTLGFEEPVNSTDKVVTFSYQYDKTTVNATGLFDSEMQNGTIEIKTTDDVTVVLQISNGELVYGASSYVEKGGVKIGTIEERGAVPVVHYSDGTFESLQ